MRQHPIHLHMNDDGTIHDQFCRCTSCKPGTLEAKRAAIVERRWNVACVVFTLLFFAMIVVRVAFRI